MSSLRNKAEGSHLHCERTWTSRGCAGAHYHAHEAADLEDLSILSRCTEIHADRPALALHATYYSKLVDTELMACHSTLTFASLSTDLCDIDIGI